MVRVIATCGLVEIEDCGHPVPLDRPDAFLAVVRPFLMEGRA